ncbi:MAG: serine/threonine-protein kinase, partial [Planctomycetota bacterium]
ASASDSTTDAESSYLAPGHRIGAFEVERLIATGGMGAVYAAIRVEDGVRQRVAIKLLRRRPTSDVRRDGETEKRFLLERQVLASLRDPSITALFDVGTTSDGRPYLVMEYVEGLPIDTYCWDRALSDHAIARLLARVCDAVQHAHQSLVLHRDLKPQNILVCDDGTPKVLDFGIARLLDPEGEFESVNTRSGAFLGTLAYAAPEQLRGEKSADTRCDIYSLGVVMYRLLTGQLPHGDSTSLPAYLERADRVLITKPSDRRASVPADIDAVVTRAMSTDRERRYQSAREFAADLRRFASGEPVEARSDSNWYVLRSEIKRRRVPILVAAAVLIASVIFGVLATMQADRLRERSLELELALHANRFREGRLLGQAGNLAAAESLLWSCAETEAMNGALPRLADWGLRELYSRHRIDATLRIDGSNDRFIGGGAGGVVYAIDGTASSLVSIDPDGDRTTIRERFMPRAATLDQSGRVLAWLDDSGTLWTGAVDSEIAHIRGQDLVGQAEIAVSDDGRVVTALAEGRLLCSSLSAAASWEINDGVRTTAVSASGRVFGICDNATVREWNRRNGSVLETWPIDLGKGRPAIAADSEGELLAFASGSELTVLQTSTGETRQVVAANGWIESIRFVNDADGAAVVVTASADYGVRFWSADTLGLILEAMAHRDRPSVLLSMDAGRGVLSVDRGGVGRIWSLELEKQPSGVMLGTGTVFDLAVNKSGDCLLAALDDAMPRVIRYDLTTGEAVQGPPADDPVSAVEWLPTGSRCVAATYGGDLFLFESVPDGLVPVWGTSLSGPANTLAVSPDGDRVAVGTRGVIEVFRTADGTPIGRVDLKANRTPMLRWRAGSIYAVSLPDSSVARVDPGTMRAEVISTNATVASGIRSIDVSDDGRLLAFAGDDAVVRVWQKRAAGWQPYLELSGHREGVFDLAFGPDGILASGARNGTVRIWSLHSGSEISRIDALTGMVFDVEFSGDRLYVAGSDATLRWYDTRAADGRVERSRPPQRAVQAGS